MCLQYHEILLRRRVVTQRRRLIDSSLLQRLQLYCHLQHQHEHQHVDQMFTMLDSHVQHTTDQFAYVQGQITTLSFQIEDLSVDHGSDSKSDQL